MLHESIMIDEQGSINALNRLGDERRSRLASHEATKHQNKSLNVRVSALTTSYQEEDEEEEEDQDQDSVKENMTNNRVDESMPVFKGVKMISSDFVDYDTGNKRQSSSVRVQLNTNNTNISSVLSLSNVPSTSKNVDSMPKTQTVRSLQPKRIQPIGKR